MGWYDDYYKPYVPVAQRRAEAAREVARRIKRGEAIRPVVIEGRNIASTFWGKAWCDHLESYSDYANRLPRGRTYVRNGSVVHLGIEPGRIKALVSGSSIYDVQIQIDPLPPAAWRALKERCAGQIGTIVELLQGKLSKAVMETVTDRDRGLFPKPREIRMRCSCPDGAGMCKHLAAVLYGVGSRLDSAPELLFQLRGVDHLDLIAQAIPAPTARAKGKSPEIAAADLGDIFGIELAAAPPPRPKPRTPVPPAAKPAAAPPVAPVPKVVAAKKAPAVKAKPAPVAATEKTPTPPPTPTPVAAKGPSARPALRALVAGTKPAPAASAKKTPVAAVTKQVPAAPAKPAPVVAKSPPARPALKALIAGAKQGTAAPVVPAPAARAKKPPRSSTK